MRTSEKQSNLSAALFAAWQQFPPIAKTKQGQAGNRPFMYAPFEAVLDAVRPVLIEHGLLLTQGTESHNLVTRIEHAASGEWRETSMPINEQHANMQSYGIELTYRRRYAVVAMLGIVTEDDTDGVGEKRNRKGVNLTQSGPPRGSARDALKDAFDGLQPEVQASMRKAAEHMTTAMPRAGDALSIFEMAASQWPDEDQAELKKGVWYLLDSKTRSTITAHERSK